MLLHHVQAALQAADRAVLAYYGRGHPLGATNLPHELYEVKPCSSAGATGTSVPAIIPCRACPGSKQMLQRPLWGLHAVLGVLK